MPQRSNSARYLWGDRNPAQQQMYYSGTPGPHADTVRSTYTVPAGKKAIIGSVYMITEVVTVAAPSGEKVTYLSTTISAIQSREFEAILTASQNTVDNLDKISAGVNIVLAAGDNVALRSVNAGTGGTCVHRGVIHVTEYDA